MVHVDPDVRTIIDPKERFEELFRTHILAVRAYVGRAWSSLDCEDIVSMTFEVAWRRRDVVDVDAPRGWLIGIARNCALNQLRASRRRTDHLAMLRHERFRSATQLFDTSVPNETVEALRLSLATLKPSDQEVLLLSAWGGLVGEDLGAALGISGSTAAVRLFRARERLQNAFHSKIGSA
ncbi:MAG: sigma-70 family RNA polymerase sigma factor [Ilumatobacteraceae bacterium]